MNKIDKLIAELCPNGVNFFIISDVFEFRNGYTPSKAKSEYWENGSIPWFRMEDIRKNGSILNDSIQKVTTLALKNKPFPKNSIIVGTTATIGVHALITVNSIANQQFTYLVLKKEFYNIVNIKYFYYYMYLIDTWLKNSITKNGFATVNNNNFKKIKIPIPPMEIQDDLVKILDSFSELEAELEAELEVRTQQYEHYLRKMFDLSAGFVGVPNIDKMLKELCSGRIESKKIKEVFQIKRGKRVVKRDLNDKGKYPVFQNKLMPMGYYDKFNVDGHNTYLISAGAAGQIGFCDKEFWAADDCLIFNNMKETNPKFLYYFLKTKQSFINSNVRNASIPRLSNSVVENIIFPIVPLKIQNEIVKILDSFSYLVTSISEGIPAEMKVRRQQYEYYRNKLLTFEELK